MELFPSRRDVWEKGPRTENPPPFTQEELRKTVERLRNGKAPGIDELLVETLKIAAEDHPAVLLKTMNTLLEQQTFPVPWKMGRVVLIPKGSPTDDADLKYRPICLLSSLAKMYESLIRDRLLDFLEEGGALAENQYGFRKGRSTTQAIEQVREAANTRAKWCLLVTLDVKNAFNSASWADIITKLRDRDTPTYIVNIVTDYFTEREIVSGTVRKRMSAGVPQGSVLGPTLWDVLYDDVLRLPLPQGARIIGYADDLALIVEADKILTLNRRTEEAAEMVTDWLEEHHLKLATGKTEALVLKGPYKKEDIDIRVDGERVGLSKTIQYLGVTFDTQGYFGPHVLQTITKAERRLTALTRLMPNIGGPNSMKRIALWGVVKSIILYAAPVWYRALNVERYRGKLEAVQRKVLLRVGHAYKTVSAQAIQVITGIPPIDMLTKERVKIWQRGPDPQYKKVAEEETKVAWQERWAANVTNAQWTKRLIPRIRTWTECRHRRLGYWLTQFFTGHGSFRAFTHRINKDPTDACRYCGDQDTPEHTVFRCDRWAIIRTQEWGHRARDLTADNIVEEMTRSMEDWDKITRCIEKIMSNKEKEERAFQSGNPPPGY